MDDEQIRPLTPREADEYENARPSWEKYFEQGFSWILIIGNFVLVLLLFTYPYCEEPEYDLWSGTWSECDDSDEDEIFIYFIGFNLTAFLLFIVYFKFYIFHLFTFNF